MSSQEIEEIKNNVDIVEVIQNFVDLEYRGSFYTGYCPFHQNNSLGTFKVYPNKGYCKCYSCMDKPMDAIQFLKAMGNTFKETLQILKGEKEINGSVVSKATPKAPVAEFVYIKPTHRFTLEDYKHFKYGYPDNVYEYFNEENEFIGSVLRFNLPDGSKYTPPFNSRIAVKEGYRNQKNGIGKGTYFKIGDIESTFCGFGNPKPIYGIEQLKLKPEISPIIIVEGEPCKDYLHNIFKDSNLVVLSLTGGVNNVDKTDLSVIKDRTVYLWADNDWSHIDKKDGKEKPKEEQPGIKFMLQLKEVLEKDNKVYWIDTYDRSKMCGWDVRDSGFTAKEIANYIKERI